MKACGFSFGGGGGSGSSVEDIIPSPEGANPTADQSGATFTNEGAAGSTDFNLPEAPPIGTNYKFQSVEDHALFIMPGSSGEPIVLYPDGEAPFGINTDTQKGQTIWLMYSKENFWSVISMYGVFTAITPP